MLRMFSALFMAMLAAVGLSTLGFLSIIAVAILGMAWLLGGIFLGPARIVTTTLAFLLALFVANTALSFFLLGSNGIFRGEDALNYPNSAEQVTTAVPHKTADLFVEFGDLAAMAQRAGVPFEAEPRRLRFRIDSLGFRNDTEFSDQDWIFLGDSMIYGASNDQSDILSAVLERESGIRAYNVAYAGHPRHYLDLLSYFDRKHPGSAGKKNIVLFLFEGNDFVEIPELERWGSLMQGDQNGSNELKLSALSQFVLRYHQDLVAESQRDTTKWPSWLRALYTVRVNLPLYRTTKSGFQRAVINRLVPSFDTKVVVSKIVQGSPMLFYRPYCEVVQRPKVESVPLVQEALDKLSNRIAHVFFLPDKMRFYPDPGVKTPHAQWEALARVCNDRGIACSDLTDVLRICAHESARNGELIFRRDDTHWTASGIRCAAKAVAPVLLARQEKFSAFRESEAPAGP